jgi:hypothetical protein
MVLGRGLCEQSVIGDTQLVLLERGGAAGDGGGKRGFVIHDGGEDRWVVLDGDGKLGDSAVCVCRVDVCVATEF